MNDISTADLLELQFMLESSIDVQFQAWMAITFAVIVASYSGRSHLTTLVRIVICTAYVMAAYALFARWATESVRIGLLAEVLRDRGISLKPLFGSGQFRFATYILGTLITAITLFYFGRIKEEDRKMQNEGEH